MRRQKDADTIKLDFDFRVWVPEEKKLLRRMADLLWPKIKLRISWKISPSGRGYHFFAKPINRKGLGALKIMLCQALCGSDLGRERANLARWRYGTKNWNRLFSTKRIPLSLNDVKMAFFAGEFSKKILDKRD